MSNTLAALIGLPVLSLLCCGLLPSRWANHHIQAMRTVAWMLMLMVTGSSVVAACDLIRHGTVDVAVLAWTWPLPANVGVYFDSLSAVMACLVSFIGLIITNYSIRYLHGDSTQGRFLRWMLFTLGAVLMMVISGNLLMFTAAWFLSSFGLHQLLTHYADRPWAIWAARKKFLISRLGDFLLIAALALTYSGFGTFNYSELFAVAQSASVGESPFGGLNAFIGLLFVLAAMTKSAQVPFHSWLPDTMETPTPVSALMHAGVINAGGFLVIRLSPIIAQSHLALNLLVLVGGCTVIFGGVVMLTQTSIKRNLAYSTIAQMGFMMLQCGLGAFSAALLHIVAHSLYKAHAFLSSGSVLDSAARIRMKASDSKNARLVWIALPMAAGVVFGLAAIAHWLWDLELSTKPGAAVLGLILTVALTHLVWRSMQSGVWQSALSGVASAVLVGVLYFVGYAAFDHILAYSVSHQAVSPLMFDLVVAAIVGVGFVGLFAIQISVTSGARWQWLRRFYVHASHGFYLDIPARRLTSRIWGGTAPTP